MPVSSEHATRQNYTVNYFVWINKMLTASVQLFFETALRSSIAVESDVGWLRTDSARASHWSP